GGGDDRGRQIVHFVRNDAPSLRGIVPGREKGIQLAVSKVHDRIQSLGIVASDRNEIIDDFLLLFRLAFSPVEITDRLRNLMNLLELLRTEAETPVGVAAILIDAGSENERVHGGDLSVWETVVSDLTARRRGTITKK